MSNSGQNKTLITVFFLFVLFISSAQPPENYKNPILPGFHPDPSICRVGDDYYMVNSSFEWFPGMPIHHSKDLVNWELVGYGLHRPEQIPLQEGLKDYMGIFAVTIRHHEGLFYLITTCVQCKRGGNFYITAKDPAGPWSDPVWLDSPGIDPSLMWDDNGKCYYVGHGNLDGEQDWPNQQGAWLQELDTEQQKLVGPRKQLTHGHANNAVWTEAPHLYKIKDKYMLMVAEGGTEYNHAVTIHHSDSLWGPYISDQINPVLSHRQLGKNYPIYAVGHADLVQTQNGDWWAVALGKRNYEGITVLARETFLTPVVFEGQTPIFNPGIGRIEMEQKRPDLSWTPFPEKPIRDNFDTKKLDLKWNFLRTPFEKWYNIKSGKLIINLRPQILEKFENASFIAQRIKHHKFKATTSLKFSSDKENEKVGLVIYRRSNCHFQLLKVKDELVLIKTLKGEQSEEARINYKHEKLVLQAVAAGRTIQFYFGKSEKSLKPIGEKQDLYTVSFEAAGGFNGPFIGMYATSSGQPGESKAEFDWFEYEGE